MLKRRLRASVCGVFCALACGMAHTTSFAKAYPEFGTTEPEAETLRWAWGSAQRYSGLLSREAVDGYKKIPVYIVTPAQMEQDVCANDPAKACSEIGAYFDQAKGRMLVSTRLTDLVGSTEDISFLVHEYVHVLQAERKTYDQMYGTCAASSATEQQAYRAQDAFLWREGKFARFSPSPEFFVCEKDRRQPMEFSDSSGFTP